MRLATPRARAREGGLVGGVSGIEAALSTALNCTHVCAAVWRQSFLLAVAQDMSLVLHWSDAVADACMAGGH